MPDSAARFTGTYTIVPSAAAVSPPIPPDEKGLRYLSDKLHGYANAELDLKVTDAQVEGRLRASVSQWFDVYGSLIPGSPVRSIGHLKGNKGRAAAFTAVFGDDRLTFSLVSRREDGSVVSLRSLEFVRRAPAAPPVPRDADAALVEQWTTRLRRSRFTLQENAFDRDYSGGGSYQEMHRALQLYADGTFRLDERGFVRVSAGGIEMRTPIARSRTGRWSVMAARYTARLMLSSDAGDTSYVLSGDGSRMSLDGRWQGRPEGSP